MTGYGWCIIDTRNGPCYGSFHRTRKEAIEAYIYNMCGTVGDGDDVKREWVRLKQAYGDKAVRCRIEIEDNP